MRSFFTLFFGVLSTFGMAQNRTLDSLKSELAIAPDSIKGSVLREVIIQTNLINPDSALLYVGKLKALAIKTSDSSRLIEAKSFESEYYWRKSDYKTSMIHAMEALTMAESSNKFFARRGTIYFTLGNIHLYLLNTTQAIDYYKRALGNYGAQKTKPKQVASILNNIGVVFMDAAESEKKPEFLDSAESYFNRVLDKSTVANPGTLINASGNLGLIHLQRNQLDKSLKAFKQWERLEAANPSITAQAMHKGNIGRLYILLGEPGKGVDFLLSGLKAAKEIEATHEMQEYYGNLAKAYGELKDYKKAYEFSSLFVTLRDSVFNAEKTKTISELEEKYQSELKEKQITELQQANTIKDLEATTARQWQIGLVIFLILLTIVVAVLYNRNKLKQRTAKVLDAKNTELQKLNAFKDRMFAVISHDLRNPVDAFSTIIESLNQNLQHASKEELKEFLESTLQSAKDLKSLLNNLLEWSLVQIGKLPFNPTTFSVHSVVGQSVAHVETMAASKRIQIINRIDEQAKALADPSMITIVMRNLLSNAIKFSGEGKAIEVSARMENGVTAIALRDQGLGMTEQETKKLFRTEEDTRTIGHSTEKGAGIGLLLCKELVDRNKGSIRVASEFGKGSTFTIELPTA
jgi:signal transduction histidine kinase/tetratricopeptide (TPR) repeat protein